jgi:hypothetical protein
MYVKHINFITHLAYMFRPLQGHHQAFHLNVIKTLRTLLGSQLMFARYEVTSRLKNSIQIKTLN